ncbi:MAG: COX15/CtaA family protein [Verrucomicrobiota bacterium]
MSSEKNISWFQKLAVTTVLAVLFLIFVGGLVRASGAGLGCPDWPKCWGLWLPPSGVEAIDASQYDVAQFNATKMWIEYVNRLIGVAIGFLVLATAIAAGFLAKQKPWVFTGAFLSLLLVLVQAWLGGEVVKSGLTPGVITLHMILAVIILCLLLTVTYVANDKALACEVDAGPLFRLRWLVILLFGVSIAQLVLGSQVRESLEMMAKVSHPIPREERLEEVGFVDHLHRSLSWLVLILAAALWWFAGREQVENTARLPFWILLSVVFQVVVGISLAYGGLPPAAQVLHLIGAVVLLSLQYLFLLQLFLRMRSSQASAILQPA